MNTTRFLVVLVGFLGLGSVRGADLAKAAERVEVVFDHPEKFTDVKDSYSPTEKGTAYILDQIKHFIVTRASERLPKGYSLVMTFTDIDLAGDFEPWRGAEFDSVRIVKSIYPPAYRFSYAFKNPDGKVVKEGKEDVVDMSFDLRLTIDTSDPLRYEKDFLNEWLSGKIREISKS